TNGDTCEIWLAKHGLGWCAIGQIGKCGEAQHAVIAPIGHKDFIARWVNRDVLGFLKPSTAIALAASYKIAVPNDEGCGLAKGTPQILRPLCDCKRLLNADCCSVGGAVACLAGF